MSKSSKRFWIISLSIGAHAAVFTIAFVTNLWRIDRLDTERMSVSLAVLAPPPAPSGGPEPGKKPLDPTPKLPPKKIVKDTTQPVVVPDKKPDAPPADDSTGGGGQGDKHGPGDNPDGDPTDTGTCHGPACGPATAPVEPPKPEPKPVVQTVVNVPISMLKGNRIKGVTAVPPSDVVKTQMLRDDHKRVVGSFKLCLSDSGNVSSVSTIKSTAYPDYDRRLIEAMSAWVYKPWLVNGRAVPVCSAVSFVYTME